MTPLPGSSARVMPLASMAEAARMSLEAWSKDGTIRVNCVVRSRAYRPLPAPWEIFRFSEPPETHNYNIEERLPCPEADMANTDRVGAWHRVAPPPVAPLPTMGDTDPDLAAIITEAQLHTEYLKPRTDPHKFVASAQHSKQAFDEIFDAHPMLIRAWSINRMWRPRLKERLRTMYNTLAVVGNVEFDRDRDVVVHFERWTDRKKLLMLNDVIASLSVQLYTIEDEQGNCTGAWCRFERADMVARKRGAREYGLKLAVSWAQYFELDPE